VDKTQAQTCLYLRMLGKAKMDESDL
jgi:hypothetical protein